MDEDIALRISKCPLRMYHWLPIFMHFLAIFLTFRAITSELLEPQPTRNVTDASDWLKVTPDTNVTAA